MRAEKRANSFAGKKQTSMMSGLLRDYSIWQSGHFEAGMVRVVTESEN